MIVLAHSRFQQKNPCSIREAGKPQIVILVEKKKQSEFIFKDWRTRAERERSTFLVGRIYIFEIFKLILLLFHVE